MSLTYRCAECGGIISDNRFADTCPKCSKPLHMVCKDVHVMKHGEIPN